MAAVMKYTKREDKVKWEGRQLVTGINCRPATVYEDFMRTKQIYHKEGGTMFYHMVQNFPKGADVDPKTAHAAAVELAGYFKDYEVLVCTHTDREHIHSHFIINSVNFETGKKASHGGSTDTGAAAAQRHSLRAVPPAGVRAAAGEEKRSRAQGQADDHRRVPCRGEGSELEVPAHGNHRRVYGIRENARRVHDADAQRGLRRQVDGHPKVHHLYHAGRRPLPR